MFNFGQRPQMPQMGNMGRMTPMPMGMPQRQPVMNQAMRTQQMVNALRGIQ